MNDKQASKHKQYERVITEESYSAPDKQGRPFREDSVHDMGEWSQVPEDEFENKPSRENIER